MNFTAPINYITIDFSAFPSGDGWRRTGPLVCSSSRPESEHFLNKRSSLPPLQPFPYVLQATPTPIHSANIYRAPTMSPAPRSLLEEVRVEGGGWWKSAFRSCQLSWLVESYLIGPFEVVDMSCDVCAVSWTTCYRRCGYDSYANV